MKIALITDNHGRMLQAKTMYDSLNTNYIVNKLQANHNLTVLTHDQLQTTNLEPFDTIIFTTSQVYWYKQYVELNISFIDKNKLIPSFESLLSHENKAYEYMWLKTHATDCLYFKNYSDLTTFINDDNHYPLVLKTPSGSSSRGVKICKDQKSAINFIKKIRNAQLISELAMTPIIQWPHHLRDTRNNANFIVQACIENYEGDYRVQVMGDRFFVYYRQLKPNHKYTSGNGSINNYQVEVDHRLLDKALELQTLIKSPHIIFDFIIQGENVHVLEFSAIHPSNVALDNCPVFYSKQDNSWQQYQVDPKLIREDHYIYAYEYAIKQRKDEL